MAIDLGNPVARDAPLNRGLIGKFMALPNVGGQTWTNLVSQRFPATLANGAAWRMGSRPGGFGGVYFDGSDDSASASASFADALSAVTAALWIKPTAIGDLVGFANKFNSVDGGWIIESGWSGIVGSSTGFLFGASGAGGGDYGYTASGMMAAGEWVHVTLVFDGSQATNATRLIGYVNGVSKALTYVGTIPSSLPTNATPFYLGRRFDGRYSNATLDDVTIYNRALPADEVWRLYAASRLGYQRELRRTQTVRAYDVPVAAGGPFPHHTRRCLSGGMITMGGV